MDRCKQEEPSLEVQEDGRVVAGKWCAFSMRILHQVAGALMFLHQSGASHGRLQPANVLLKVVGQQQAAAQRI